MHSPEIAYLEPGENGVMTADDLPTYVNATVQLLQDPSTMARLQAGAARAGQAYSVEHFANRFSEGILKCLERGPHRG